MKTIIITGGNSGIGYHACLQLAALDHKVIMICRNEASAKEKCDEIKRLTNNNNIFYYIANLAEIKSVKAVAEAIALEYKTIDVLINNAADFDLSNKTAKFNTDGIEKQFATNVVAPFILGNTLLPTLEKTKGKIINISSQGLMLYPNIKLDFNNLNAQNSYKPDKTYYQNKLALLMFSLFMKDKYKDITFNAVRVTNVKIDINKYPYINSFLKTMYKFKSLFSISPEEMAKTYVKLAINDYTGFLYDEKMKEVKANKAVYNKETQEKLYKILIGYIQQ